MGVVSVVTCVRVPLSSFLGGQYSGLLGQSHHLSLSYDLCCGHDQLLVSREKQPLGVEVATYT